MKLKICNLKKLMLVALMGSTLITTSACTSEKKVYVVNSNEKQNDENNKFDLFKNNDNKNIIKEDKTENKEDNIDNKKDGKQNEEINNTNDNKDNIIISYFEEAKNTVDEILSSKKITNYKEKTKKVFILTADFIFNDGEINGITFNELSDTCKTKIVIIMNTIDEKIEKNIPNYKETIRDKSGRTYNYIKEKIKEQKNELKDKFINKYGIEKYNSLINDSNVLKEETKDYYNNVKDKTKNKIKEFYNNFKNN